MNFNLHPFRNGVNCRNSDAVKAATHFVGTVVKFTSGVEFGHDDLGRRDAKFIVFVNWNASPVVSDGQGVVIMQDDLDNIVESSQVLVN